MMSSETVRCINSVLQRFEAEVPNLSSSNAQFLHQSAFFLYRARPAPIQARGRGEISRRAARREEAMRRQPELESLPSGSRRTDVDSGKYCQKCNHASHRNCQGESGSSWDSLVG